MAPTRLIASAFALGLGLATPAFATVGCTVTSPTDQTAPAALYSKPQSTAPILRTISPGDIVFLPQADLAPAQKDGWAWVRHDATQQDIWQSGIYGWLPATALSECG